MTTEVDIANRAFQAIGTRTTISSLSENSNDAKQANLVFGATRDELLRMAPWNCAKAFANATYITSVPGTPENATSGLANWAPGIPAPPYAYEYQYPVDCLRPLWVVPQFSTGFAGGIPITTAITGGAPGYWNGPPVKFGVSTDLFYPVTAAAVVAGGTGYAVGDIITLPRSAPTATPIGAPVQLRVVTAPAGVVATVSVVNVQAGASPSIGGSYFTPQTGTIAQDTTTGVGVGATFTLTFGAQGSQRVILTNQQDAILCFLRQVTDPNVMDPEFLKAWAYYLGGTLAFQLTGDTATANAAIGKANQMIDLARVADGNEGLTINDVTPDWIRVRGYVYPGLGQTPNQYYDWGPMLGTF